MFEIKAKILAILLVVVCLIVLFRMSGGVNFRSNPKVKLSDLSEEECVEFIKAKGIEIPDDLNNEELGIFVKNIIVAVEQDPTKNFAISYTTTLEFIEEIRKAVIEYYQGD